MAIPLGSGTYHPTLALRYKRTFPNAMDIVIRDSGGDRTRTIPAGDYVIEAPTDPGLSDNLLTKVWEALDDIWTVEGYLGAPEVAIDKDGRTTFRMTGNLSTLFLKIVDWHADLRNALGFDPLDLAAVQLPIDETWVNTPFLADCQWVPGIAAIYDTGDEERELLAEETTLTGIPHLVSHTASWFERELLWEFIAAARVKNSRVTDSRFVGPACLNLNDTNAPFERFMLYLKGGIPAPNPGRIHIRPTPPDLVVTRPPDYYVVLGKSGLLQNQVSRELLFDGGIEAYDLQLFLRKV